MPGITPLSLILAIDKRPASPLLVAIVLTVFAVLVLGYRIAVYLSNRYVMEHGQVVIAALVQANSKLFSWGLKNWPAQVLFSFENVPQHYLGQLAGYVASLKGRSGLTEVEQKVARTVNNEQYVAGLRVKLPVEFTGGPAVYSAHVIIRRRYLPRGYIDGSFFRCMVIPGRLSFWQEFFGGKLIMVPFDYQPERPTPPLPQEELLEVLPAEPLQAEPFPPAAEPLDELPDLGPAPAPAAAYPQDPPIAPPVQQPRTVASATLPAATVAFSCVCGKQLHAPASCAGRQSKCPGCGRLVTVPAPPPGAAPALPAPVPAAAMPATASATQALPPASSAKTLTVSHILAMVSLGLGLCAVLSLSLGSVLLLFILGMAGLVLGGLGYATSRQGNRLSGERLALAGVGLNFGAAVIGLVVLVVMGIGALFGDKPVAHAVAPNAPTGDALSSDWQVIFCSADPKIWDQNINRGPSDFARPLTAVAGDIRYLRIRKDSDYVILAMTRQRLQQVGDDGRFGWSTKQEDSGAFHLGIYDLTRECQDGDICVRSIPWCAGWGFGHIHFRADVQGYCWDGKPIQPCVFEIAVKKEGLTAAESKKLLGK